MQVRHVVLREHCAGELQIGIDVERAVFVGLEKCRIPASVCGCVDEAAVSDEFAPRIVAVCREQGVVEIENCQCQGQTPP